MALSPASLAGLSALAAANGDDEMVAALTPWLPEDEHNELPEDLAPRWACPCGSEKYPVFDGDRSTGHVYWRCSNCDRIYYEEEWA